MTSRLTDVPDFPGLYEWLRIPSCASDEEIKQAHLILAKEFMPAANRGDAVGILKMQRINRAREVLLDPEQRQEYDDGPVTPEVGPSTPDFSDYEDADSPLGNIVRGRDIIETVTITAKDAYLGATVTAKLLRNNILTTVRFAVPAGTKSGRVLRLKGLGEKGIVEGIAGDALITIRVATQPKPPAISLITRLGANPYRRLSRGEHVRMETHRAATGKAGPMITVPPLFQNSVFDPSLPVYLLPDAHKRHPWSRASDIQLTFEPTIELIQLLESHNMQLDEPRKKKWFQ